MARGNGTGGTAGEGRPLPVRTPDHETPSIFELDGLLVTVLPDGGVALMESHADGATSVVTLDARRLEALLERLRPTGPPEPGERTATPAGESPGERPAEPEAPEAASGADEDTSDWGAYDEELKAAFLLEQYAGGVDVGSLPPGWEDILEGLPAALAARSRRTRARLQREAGRPARDDHRDR
jgi:hypothetical protein